MLTVRVGHWAQAAVTAFQSGQSSPSTDGWRADLRNSVQNVRWDLEKTRSAMFDSLGGRRGDLGGDDRRARDATVSLREVDAAVSAVDRLLGILSVPDVSPEVIAEPLKSSLKAALNVFSDALERAVDEGGSVESAVEPGDDPHSLPVQAPAARPDPIREASDQLPTTDAPWKRSKKSGNPFRVCTKCDQTYLPEVAADRPQSVGGGLRRGRCQDCRSAESTTAIEDLVEIIERIRREETLQGRPGYPADDD